MCQHQHVCVDAIQTDAFHDHGKYTLTMTKQCIWTITSHKSLPFMQNGDALLIKSTMYGVHITYETTKYIYLIIYKIHTKK
jgi:hypothetical protein